MIRVLFTQITIFISSNELHECGRPRVTGNCRTGPPIVAAAFWCCKNTVLFFISRLLLNECCARPWIFSAWRDSVKSLSARQGQERKLQVFVLQKETKKTPTQFRIIPIQGHKIYRQWSYFVSRVKYSYKHNIIIWNTTPSVNWLREIWWN